MCTVKSVLRFACLVSPSTELCVDHSPPGSSVHGILQARILEWVAVPFSSRFSHPGIKPGSPALQADSLPSELPRKVHPTDKEMEAERSEIRCPR